MDNSAAAGNAHKMIPQPCKWTVAGQEVVVGLTLGIARAATRRTVHVVRKIYQEYYAPHQDGGIQKVSSQLRRRGSGPRLKRRTASPRNAGSAAKPACLLDRCDDYGKKDVFWACNRTPAENGCMWEYLGGTSPARQNDIESEAAQLSPMIIPDSFFQIFIEERPPHDDNPEGKPWMWIFINRDPGINQAIEILDKTRTKVIWSGCRMSPGGSSKWPCKFGQVVEKRRPSEAVALVRG